MRSLMFAALAVATCGLAGAASAQTAPVKGDLHRASSGDIYFHKAGATWDDHTADMRRCFADARSFHQPSASSSYEPYQPGTFSDHLADEIGSALGKAAAGAMLDRAARPANIENCMIAGGWEAVRAAKSAGLDRGKPEALAKALAPLVGAAAVQGEVARTFTNEAANAETVIYQPSMPFSTQSLSFVAFNAEEEARLKAAPKPARTPPKPALLEVKADTPDKLGAPNEGQAVVVVRFKGKSGRSVTFVRQGGPAPMPGDGKPDAFFAQALGGKAKDPVFAVALPPGRWALAAIASGGSMSVGAIFCYGAPGFDLRPGDVVFAGSFEPKGANLPDMDISAAKQALADKPGLAEKLKPAAYVNGNSLDCGGVGYGYALETPGAPFVDGYALGSKASAAPPAPAGAVTKTGG